MFLEVFRHSIYETDILDRDIIWNKFVLELMKVLI